MKLNDLRPLLIADSIDLYLEKYKPIHYEIWGLDDETHTLAEYRRLDEPESKEGDTMFFKYGNYEVTEIDYHKDAIAIFIKE